MRTLSDHGRLFSVDNFNTIQWKLYTWPSKLVSTCPRDIVLLNRSVHKWAEYGPHVFV
jgi:hypothetical protein